MNTKYCFVKVCQKQRKFVPILFLKYGTKNNVIYKYL